MNTVLITGCSSGFGLETARYFLDREWRVIATMRSPAASTLPSSDRLLTLALDVTDAASIQRAVEAAGPIDVLVNNAGFGAMTPFESTPIETARALFETNTLGTMALTQAVLPQFRERKAGVIVNVTSIVTERPFPLLSVYTASKAAVNAFSASLALELAQFDVRVHVVQPGRAPSTQFGDNARARTTAGISDAYADFAHEIFSGIAPDAPTTRAIDVAEAVWRAATDPTCPPRLAAGADAVALAAAVATQG
ncbi:SDR family oxidoreductase [Massilia sp. METH4]|uniref:SDR family oxidoreductase n=1 Tax=Massilia sp. METH4 TaxID=3123041 RepID=UPI0030D41AB2